jgi:hypothetical protein
MAVDWVGNWEGKWGMPDDVLLQGDDMDVDDQVRDGGLAKGGVQGRPLLA